MSTSWVSRKCRLAELLNSQGDEDADGAALDRLLHGQNVIGLKTSKTTEIEELRFQNRDLRVLGTLEAGQFGLIDVVNCRLDGRVYVRKSIEKRLALRASDQCSPQFERDILLHARKSNTPWVPHLLCAYQTDMQLSMIMTYEEGGNLWNVLESSPTEGRVSEQDLLWWMPQMISAISWCHMQGFAHRDIKPHNFVISLSGHLKLIDFGSVAPFVDDDEGNRRISSKYCAVPCGTCDYISPEVLNAHEQALVALELDDDERSHLEHRASYGAETDWWSFGAMIYEMLYGVAPFFAKEVRHTYLKIMEHRKSLRFNAEILVSQHMRDLLGRLLTDAECRLGRRDDLELADHSIFRGIEWDHLAQLSRPPSLHTPEFEYLGDQGQDEGESYSQGFPFSALFQSSVDTTSPGVSVLRQVNHSHSKDPSERSMTAPFIGFSWGPPLDAFPPRFTASPKLAAGQAPAPQSASKALLTPAITRDGHLTPRPASLSSGLDAYATPLRPSFNPHPTPYQTLPRTANRAGASTVKRRLVSEQEAMRQLVDCIGQSARKKVLDSGRKPRILSESFFDGAISFRGGGSGSGRGISGRLKRRPSAPDFMAAMNNTVNTMSSFNASSIVGGTGRSSVPPQAALNQSDGSAYVDRASSPLITSWEDNDETSSSDGEYLPPSPSPRPGSVMSRRSVTPTLTMTMTGTGTFSSNSNSRLIARDNSGSTRTTTLPATSSSSSQRKVFSRSRAQTVSASPAVAVTANRTSSSFSAADSNPAPLLPSLLPTITSTPRPRSSSASTSTPYLKPTIHFGRGEEPIWETLELRHGSLLTEIERLEASLEELQARVG